MTSLSGQSQRNDLSYTAPRGTSRLSRGGDSPLRPVTAGEGPAALPSPPRSPGSLFGSREPALGCRGQGPHPAFGSCITGLTSQPPPPSITQPPNLLSPQTALPHHLHRPAHPSSLSTYLPPTHPHPPSQPKSKYPKGTVLGQRPVGNCGFTDQGRAPASETPAKY